MATPLTARTFEAMARAARIPLNLHEGWSTRNRGTRGDGWGPVNGVMIHHTVTKSLESTISVATRGRDDLPGPLYAGVVDKQGVLHMVGWGRCNHAGKGDDDVLRAVIAERAAPAPNETNTDGNARFYGFAGINLGDGRDPWTAAQLNTLADVSVLICRYHRWTRNSVIGHREWQPGKIDPYGIVTGVTNTPGSLMPRIRGMVHQDLT